MAAPVPDHAYAGLVSRVGSLVIDVIVIAAVASAVRVLPGVVWEAVTNRTSPAWLTFLVATAALLLPWAYFTLAWWLIGHTLGNLVLGVTVRSRDGGEVSLIQAALRAAFGLLLIPLWLIGMLAILWDERRRAWHDRVFRTVVPYAARRPAVPAGPTGS